jgi:hypothetical protein
MMNTANLIKTMKGAINKTTIVAALRATNNMPNMLGHPYTCNGQQLAGEPAICNAYERVWQYNNGNFTAASPYIRLPAMNAAS